MFRIAALIMAFDPQYYGNFQVLSLKFSNLILYLKYKKAEKKKGTKLDLKLFCRYQKFRVCALFLVSRKTRYWVIYLGF